MENTKLQQQSSQPLVHDEHILVVPRECIVSEQGLQGFGAMPETEIIERISKHQQFLPRSQMELDERYKQIIPYVIFMYNDQLFVMERKQTASEQRLAGKLSLGIGGHIRQEDIEGASIGAWALREFYEEINYEGPVTITPLGLLNDDTNAVGKVHIGVVCLVRGTHNKISVRSELKDGWLATMEECEALLPRFESWSQIIITQKTLC